MASTWWPFVELEMREIWFRLWMDGRSKKKKVRYFNEWNRKGRRKPVSSRTPKTTRQIMELEKLLIHDPLDGQQKGRDEKWANSGKKRGRIEEENATRGANNCVLLYKSRLFEFGRPIVKNSSATYSERERESCKKHAAFRISKAAQQNEAAVPLSPVTDSIHCV